MNQLSLKAGLKKWCKKGRGAVHPGMKQIDMRDTLIPRHRKDLNKKQRNTILESRIFLEEKRDSTLKVRMMAGGNKQRDFISKKDASSTTVSTDSVLLTWIVDAEEH